MSYSRMVIFLGSRAPLLPCQIECRKCINLACVMTFFMLLFTFLRSLLKLPVMQGSWKKHVEYSEYAFFPEK